MVTQTRVTHGNVRTVQRTVSFVSVRLNNGHMVSHCSWGCENSLENCFVSVRLNSGHMVSHYSWECGNS